MLTRSKLKRGEGSLEEYNLEIGTRCTFQQQAMELEKEENLTEYKRSFQQDFFDMKSMVEELYREQRKNGEGPSQVKNKEFSGDPPPNPPLLVLLLLHLHLHLKKGN
jgi:hypothetical protein